MSRRVRVLVEMDIVIHEEEWTEDILLDSAVDFVSEALAHAEDTYERYADDKGETPYSLDTDDITVWEPTDYLGELMTIRRLSKTVRQKLRKFDRLPGADRHSLTIGKEVRAAIAHVRASCPDCAGPVPAEQGVRVRADGTQSIIVKGSVCARCGRVEP
jgi:hypothetical protein